MYSLNLLLNCNLEITIILGTVVGETINKLGSLALEISQCGTGDRYACGNLHVLKVSELCIGCCGSTEEKITNCSWTES